MLNHCIYCSIIFHPGKWWWQEIETKSRQCMYCGKVTSMPSIKITAEVDGKQMPLETVSTETFEAIKALEKPKKIPVARWATCSSEPRLLFKPTTNIELKIGRVYALDLRRGHIGFDWKIELDENSSNGYKEIVVI